MREISGGGGLIVGPNCEIVAAPRWLIDWDIVRMNQSRFDRRSLRFSIFSLAEQKKSATIDKNARSLDQAHFQISLIKWMKSIGPLIETTGRRFGVACPLMIDINSSIPRLLLYPRLHPRSRVWRRKIFTLPGLSKVWGQTCALQTSPFINFFFQIKGDILIISIGKLSIYLSRRGGGLKTQCTKSKFGR